MRHGIFSILLAVLLAAAITGQAIAQKSTLQLEKQYTVSGSWVHVVKKENLNDFTTRGSQVIADFPNREAAAEAAQKLNDALRGDDVYAWMYMASTRPKESGSNDRSDTPSSVIKNPKLSLVDPGPSASSNADKGNAESLLKRLRGRKGTGMLGSKRAEITIDDQDNLRFSGEARGSGVLKIIDDELVIEGKSNLSTVRADGDTIFGIATSKTNPDLRAKWWFRMTETAQNAEEISPPREPTKRSKDGSGDSAIFSQPTVWIRFSASGHESQVNNVSVHFHALVLYPDHTFIEYRSISSYFGTLSREAKSLEAYYGPDRLSASPYIGGTWREEDGFVTFTVERVNQNEKKKTTGFFAYKPENYVNLLRKHAIESGRLAVQRGSKSEYDLIQFPIYQEHFGNSVQEAPGNEQLVGL